MTTNDNEPPVEPTFVCEDCGIDVFVIASPHANDNERKCLTCRIIATMPESERDAVRRILNPE